MRFEDYHHLSQEYLPFLFKKIKIKKNTLIMGRRVSIDYGSKNILCKLL